MNELLQGKITSSHFLFGVCVGILGGVLKALIQKLSFHDVIINAVMGMFVALIGGLIFVEYIESATLIVAGMGVAGYMGASFFDSIETVINTLNTIKRVIRENGINNKEE